MVATKLFIGLPHSLTRSFSHEVEMDLYIPNHEKSHLDCLLVSQSLWSEVCTYVSVPPLSHRRLESKSVGKAALAKLCPVDRLLCYHLQMGSCGANTNHSLSTTMGLRNSATMKLFFNW